MLPDNFEILFVMKLMCFPSHLFVNEDTQEFCPFYLFYLSLIVTFAGVFTFFPLVLNIMKLVLSTFRVGLLEFNH